MKIYTNQINESWIIDRVISEWKENNKDISTEKIKRIEYSLDYFKLDMGKNSKKKF